MEKIIFLLCMLALCGCSNGSGTEKFQDTRDAILHVQDRITAISDESVILSRISTPFVMDDYLFILDYLTWDKYIYVLDRENYQYITAIGDKGQGPGEFVNPGCIAGNERERLLYVMDFTKHAVYGFSLDSIVDNPDYMPEEISKIKGTQHMTSYQFINDTTAYGVIMDAVGNYDFRQSAARWNMQTGEVSYMPYEHPEIEKRRISLAASIEHGIYVETFHHHDLITICTLDGELKYNIYGSKWDNKKSNRMSYFGDVAFCKDKIVVLYCGDENFKERPNGEIVGNYPTKFMVFDLDGNYLKTLETGYDIVRFCYDGKYNRIIMTLDDEIEFAYLDMGGLI